MKQWGGAMRNGVSMVVFVFLRLEGRGWRVKSKVEAKRRAERGLLWGPSGLSLRLSVMRQSGLHKRVKRGTVYLGGSEQRPRDKEFQLLQIKA